MTLFRASESASAEAPITWLDIARRLSNLDPASTEWKSRPAELSRGRIDWTGAVFEFVSGPENSTAKDRLFVWLASIFPNRVARSTEMTWITLDGPADSSKLEVLVDFRDISALSRAPLGTIDTVISFEGASWHANAAGLPVLAFHSVKGGTGRTTSAIAVAADWASTSEKPILLVDADLEAPGLSYLFRRSNAEIQVSLEDLLALAHADTSDNYEVSVNYVAERLLGQRLGRNLVVLPLRRDLDDLASSSVRSEHIASAEDPFALAGLLRMVAAKAGCGGIVVDLRAGLVPIATQLVLDPTVGKAFVSSLSGQSMEATASLLRYVSRETRRMGMEVSQPLIVVNRIPLILRQTGADEGLIRPMLDQIAEDLLTGRNEETTGDESVFSGAEPVDPFVLVRIPEIPELQATSADWEGFLGQIRSAGFSGHFSSDLRTWLNDNTGTFSTPDVVPALATGNEDKRRQLETFASKLVAAEISDLPVAMPLVTGPLRALADQFTTQVPIVVVEGAKGTGKTLTARFLCSKGSWNNAVRSLLGETSRVDAHILPVTGSIQASENYQKEIGSQRERVARALELPTPQRVEITKSLLRDALRSGRTSEERYDTWLNAIAWSSGFHVGSSDAGAGYLEYLRSKGEKVVATFEGIEELYDDPFSDEAPPFLQSLLVDVPQRLRGEPGRPLGVVVFARRDSVEAAVSQNIEQFRRRYAEFALTWSESDVLELAAWVATEAGSLSLWDVTFPTLQQSEREKRLYPLWGTKLGPDDLPTKRTKEAYTARWVVAVLSDLRGRLVARDLIHFLENAAKHVPNGTDLEFTESRLLVPRALKDAVKPTSARKVLETEEEIKELKSVFDKFRALPQSVVAPLDNDAVQLLKLEPTDIDLLRRHGILFGDVAPYEVPELFRMGLNLRHSGARHSVINLRRKARQRFGLES